MITVRYLIVDTSSSYNIIMRLHAFNLLGASLSTLYLSMKYMLPNVCIGVMQEDQETSYKCYHAILRIRRATMVVCASPRPDTHMVNFVDLDP